MDKKILLAPAILAAALIAGCGGEDTAGAPASAPPATTQAAPAMPLTTVRAEAYSLPADAPSAGHCALDAINGGSPQDVRLPASGDAVFGGWVANAALEVPADGMFVLRGADGSFAAPLATGTTERPDVAQALGKDALSRAGFDLQLSLDGVPAGSYELLVVVDAATQGTCNFNATLVLE